METKVASSYLTVEVRPFKARTGAQRSQGNFGLEKGNSKHINSAG